MWFLIIVGASKLLGKFFICFFLVSRESVASLTNSCQDVLAGPENRPVLEMSFTLKTHRKSGLPMVVLNTTDGVFPVEKLSTEVGSTPFYVQYPQSKPVGPMRLLTPNDVLEVERRAIDQLIQSALNVAHWRNVVDENFDRILAFAQANPEHRLPTTREDFLIFSGYEFGIEHIIWVFEGLNGLQTTTGVYSSDDPSIVRLGSYIDDLRNRLNHFQRSVNSIRSIAGFHNHPRRSPLSPQDFNVKKDLLAAEPSLSPLINSGIVFNINAVAIVDTEKWFVYSAQLE